MKKLIILALGVALGFASCVKDEVSPEAFKVDITNISYPTSIITDEDAVEVTATATYYGKSVSAPVLLYRVSTDPDIPIDEIPEIPIEMTRVDPDDTDKPEYNDFYAEIPAQEDQAQVSFRIKCVNGGFTTYSSVFEYTVGGPAPTFEYTAIKLNELDGNTKFIELYNTSENRVNIGGMRILKNGTSLKNEDGSPGWSVPAGTIIPVHGYAVIKCGTSYSASAPANTIIGIVDDGLSAKQTLQLELLPPTGDDTVLDIFTRQTTPVSAWGTTVNNLSSGSISRITDGTGEWKVVTGNTAGLANPTSGGTTITTTLP